MNSIRPQRPWPPLVLPGVLLLVGLAAYWPVFSFSFFWEDPFDIGQVDPYTYGQLLSVPNSNSYYRPLALVLYKALKLGGAVFAPLPYHLFVVSGHLVAVLVLFGFTRRLFRRTGYAFAAALLFLLYPIAYEATARVPVPHHWLAAAIFASLWLYLHGRETGRRWPLWAALGLMALAQTLHENGLLFPAFVLLLELWLVWQGRALRFDPFVFAYAASALAFLLLWLAIPKSGEAPSLGLHPREALYLSQGLSYPIAGFISWAGGFGLPGAVQAGLALLLTALALFLLPARSNRPAVLLALSWWLAASSLAWVARPIEYLEVSPRVMYLPGWGAALAWAALLDLEWNGFRPSGWRRWAGLAAVGGVLLASLTSLAQATRLYSVGSRLMNQIIAAGADSAPGSRLVFVNVPDRFEYRRPLYPLGYWGMLVAPVSQDLSDFIRFASGVAVSTQSLSEFRLLAEQLARAPYAANTRGSDSGPADLYAAASTAGQVFLAQYRPGGQIEVVPVGSVKPALPSLECPAQFGATARLCAAQAAFAPGEIRLDLTWQALAPAQPNDTVFVQLVDEAGAWQAGADGDSLGGLTPLFAWRPGDTVIDLRRLALPVGLPPGDYSIYVGLYNRVTGERYPASGPAGQPLPDGAYRLPIRLQP